MRKKGRLAVCTIAFAISIAAFFGMPCNTAKAEEDIAIDTDDVVADEINMQTEAPYYNINFNGGTWNGTYYVVNGTTITDAFFCDGTYTYYLQADGTPMKDRLTYHPDGEHIIYFDANGHEVFSDFAMVKKSIAGEVVDDMCFFDVYGYMYVNQLTYDKTGTKIYYVNLYGVIERNGWFQFNNGINYFNEGYCWFGGPISCGVYGYANADGSLMTNQLTYNWNKQLTYLRGDGMTIGAETEELASGLCEIEGKYYSFNSDGTIVQVYDQKPDTYTYTVFMQGEYWVFKVNGEVTTVEEYNYDGKLIQIRTY